MERLSHLSNQVSSLPGAPLSCPLHIDTYPSLEYAVLRLNKPKGLNSLDSHLMTLLSQALLSL